MDTKLVYFRPKKLDDTPDVNQLFSYEILDKSMRTLTRMTVPVNLTVYNDQGSRGFSNPRKKGTKVTVFLVGSDQCPDSIELSRPVDRIEFHGSIGYEKPVFEMIHRLPGLKKVKFFLGQHQLPDFHVCTDDKEWTNGSVTSLKIIIEKISSRVDKEREDQEQKIILQKIVLRILNRSVTSFPSLRKLTMDIPHCKEIQNVVTGLIDKFQHLKATTVKCEESTGRLIVGKIGSPPSSTSSSVTSEEMTSCKTPTSEHTVDPISPSDQVRKEAIEVDSTELLGSDQSKSALTDLGKLLESMLGIGLGMSMKTTVSEDPSTPVIPEAPELPIQEISSSMPPDEPCKAELISNPENPVDETTNYKLDEGVSVKDNEPSDVDRHSDMVEDEDEESQVVWDENGDTLEETEMIAETKPYHPMFHHPLCHDFHQYLGVPIIPGFGIGVYHYPLQQQVAGGTEGLCNDFESRTVQDTKGR